MQIRFIHTTGRMQHACMYVVRCTLYYSVPRHYYLQLKVHFFHQSQCGRWGTNMSCQRDLCLSFRNRILHCYVECARARARALALALALAQVAVLTTYIQQLSSVEGNFYSFWQTNW